VLTHHKTSYRASNFLDCLALEDGTDKFSQNFGNYQSMLRNIPEGWRSLKGWPHTRDCQQKSAETL